MSEKVQNPLPPGFLSLKSHIDLARKIARELASYRGRHPDEDGLAFNICVGLAHWPEWFATDPLAAERGYSTATEICERHPVFRECRHLANGGKHPELRKKPPELLPIQRTAAVHESFTGESSVVLHSNARPIPFVTLKKLLHDGFHAIVQITGLPWETFDVAPPHAPSQP